MNGTVLNTATNDKDTVTGYNAYLNGAKIEDGVYSCDLVGTPPSFYVVEKDTDNGAYIFSGNLYDDNDEDIKVAYGLDLNEDDIVRGDVLLVLAGSGDVVEVNDSTKFVSTNSDFSISDISGLKGYLEDSDVTAAYQFDAYALYDEDTGVALCVYIVVVTAV